MNVQAAGTLSSGRATRDALMVLVETQAFLLEGHTGGAGGVDGQHNKILDMYREIVAMLVDQPDVEAIGRNIRELYVYLNLHFSTEESLMSIMDYPARKAHAHCHRQFRKEFMKVIKHAPASPDGYADFVMSAGQWLLDHMKTSDNEFAEYCASCS